MGPEPPDGRGDRCGGGVPASITTLSGCSGSVDLKNPASRPLLFRKLTQTHRTNSLPATHSRFFCSFVSVFLLKKKKYVIKLSVILRFHDVVVLFPSGGTRRFGFVGALRSRHWLHSKSSLFYCLFGSENSSGCIFFLPS